MTLQNQLTSLGHVRCQPQIVGIRQRILMLVEKLQYNIRYDSELFDIIPIL